MGSLSETDMTKNTYSARALNNINETANAAGASITSGIDNINNKITNTLRSIEIPNTRTAFTIKPEKDPEMSTSQEDNIEYSCTAYNLKKINYIGKKSDIFDNIFKKKCDINYLPLKNLPSLYFPFYYKDIKVAKDFIIKLTSGLNDGDIDNLLFNISNINKPYQPYNKNNIYYITSFIIFFWIFILYFILRFIYVKYNYLHLFVILGLSFILLLFASIWSLIITSQNI